MVERQLPKLDTRVRFPSPAHLCFVLLLFVWLTAALIAGELGLLERLRPPMPQVILLTITTLLLFAGWRWKLLRDRLQHLPWRSLVSFHLTRFVGLYFLWLYHQHRLPRAFALPAGIGDLVVAIWAAALLVCASAVTRKPGLLLAWNIFGLADIVMVVVDAAINARTDPESMRPLLHLPLSLLLTFVVPIIIASHVWLFQKLRRNEVSGLIT